MTGVRAGLGAGALAAAVAAVAIAGLLAVPGADMQAAYAQSGPSCMVELQKPTIAFGNVQDGGAATGEETQAIRSAPGSAPLSTLSVEATQWTLTSTNAMAMPASATQVRFGSADWVALSESPGVSVAEDGELGSGWNELGIRIVPAGVPDGATAGKISQNVTYVVECSPAAPAYEVVPVGALLAPAAGSEFRDDYRQAAIEYAVAEFNRTVPGIKLDLSVHPYARGEEAGALTRAYDGGSGPQFYVGPTTSQGLENLRNDSATRAYLDTDKVILVTPSSEAPQLALVDNIFRLAANVEIQGTILVDKMKSDNIASYVVVARDDAWGRELADHVNERAAQMEMTQRGSTILFDFDRTPSYWEGIRDRIVTSVGTVPDGQKIGVFFLGYGDSYPDMASAANSSGVLRDSTAWYVPSSAIDASSGIPAGATRDFSNAVSLTALSQDVAMNNVTRAIDGLMPGRTAEFYDYSAYDSVFVLGHAMRVAVESGGNASDVASVKKYVAHAAMGYTGAALGDSLLLDRNGDLRTPDDFTVHTAMAGGNWSDGETSGSTVTRIGALVALGSTDYPDDKAWEAMREAAVDYNNATGGKSLVKAIGYDITDPSNPAGYVASSALERAYAGGSGPSVYVGPSLSSNVEAVLPYAQANNILLLGYASEAESLARADDNLFRTAITTVRQGHFMAEVMADANVSSVVTVIRDDAWGRSLNSSIVEALAANGLSPVGSVKFAPGQAASAVGGIASAIAGSEDVGVALVATMSEQEALAAAASGNSAITSAQWFVTPSGYYADMSAATRDFARAVNLTAIVLDVADSDKKAALDARVPGLDFYGYSAYDGVFILGNAIDTVVNSGKTSEINANDLRGEMHAAADAYEGILGDIVLNTNGDLRSPDRFAVWKVNSTTGNWTETGVTKQTPIVEVGALMAIDSTDYPDNKAWQAMQRAVLDYNGAGERAVYLDASLYDITNQSDSGKYVAAAALERAYASGSGPSVYVGPSLSSNVLAVYNYTQDNDIILLGYASEAESLSMPDDNLFRTAITTGRQGHFMAQVMGDAAGVSSVVTVIRDDAWGRSLNASIAEALEENGLGLAGSVKFADTGDVNWTATIAEITAAIGGSSDVGVAFVAARSEQDALAAAASGNTAITNAQWFVTPSGYYANMSAATRDFATAANMTAIVLDVAANDKKAALDARVPGLDFYGYSAYDGAFILGNAIESVVRSGKATGINATDLRGEMHSAANEYDGVLGDITLNTNGDLRSPDRFAVWNVGADGMWMDTGVRKQTPIVEVGALMAIDSTDYADNKAWDALVRAGVDYNGAGERAFYLNPNLYDITDPSNSAGYVAAAVLERAYAGGSGPSVYVGPSLSSNVHNVLAYAQANDITLLGFASESESLSIPDDNLFRTAISSARHGHFMAQIMAEAGVRSVVTVVRDDAWGRSMNASIAEALGTNALRSAGVVTFTPGEAASAAGDIASAIGDSKTAGVAFVGVRADQDAIAAAASGNAAITNAQWFVTPSGYYTDMSAATRDFAKAVNLRAIVLDVADNANKTALDARVPGLDFYGYSAYDSLFVIANALESAAASGGKMAGAVTAAELQGAIPGAASDYEGVLGDIELNSKGDLRSPDRFAVWKVDAGTGMWENTNVTKQTPIVEIGAITIRESGFNDGSRYEAMRIAVDDYNRAAEDGGALYLNMREVQTSLSPSSANDMVPDVLTAVTAASSGADGIKYYVGPSTSGNSGRLLEFANMNNLTLISPSSTAPSLATSGDALFRLVPNDIVQGKVLADVVHNQQGAILAALINQTGHEHVVMVVRNDTWGQGLNVSTSGRLDAHDVEITRIIHEEADADWSQTAMDISNEITNVRTNTPTDPIAVLHIGFPGDFVALAAQNASYPAIGSVSWFGTDGVAGAAELVSNDTARQFADAVNLTATKFDVERNDKFDRLTEALVSRGVQVRTTYEYSAYDSVFVLGRAIELAISAKDDMSYGPLDVRSSVRAAASAYEGALGDIELNRAGDVRTPNSYATWIVEGNAWKKNSTHQSTPVFDIGALLMLDNNPSYTDDDEKTAMDLAVDDFNTIHERTGDFYINLAVQRISISPTDTASPDPDALAGLKNIYANGAGPSYYVGPSTSGNSERILNYSNDNGIVIISHSSTAPKLAIPNDYLFRMTAPDTLQGVILANMTGVQASVTDLVMVVRDDVWGRGVDNSTATNLLSNGAMTDITRVMFPPANVDWDMVASDLAANITAAKTSAAGKTGKAAVLFAGFPGDFNALVSRSSSSVQLGGVEWFGADGIGNSNEIPTNATSVAFAKSVNLTTVVYTVLPNDINRRINPSAVYGPSAYDSVYVLANAINQTYGDDRMAPVGSDVKDAIRDVARAYTGALGNVTLDINGDVSSPATYGVFQIGANDMWERVRVVGSR